TGKHRAFLFLMYEDPRSTVLVVHNLNSALMLKKMLGSTTSRTTSSPARRAQTASGSSRTSKACPELIGTGCCGRAPARQRFLCIDLLFILSILSPYIDA
ncbi:hypothetical protein C8J57DRAFT_1104865, partial [Mycena rebaudengoi]